MTQTPKSPMNIGMIFLDTTLEKIQDYVYNTMLFFSDEFGPDSVKMITNRHGVSTDSDTKVDYALVITCFEVPSFEARIYRDGRPPKLRISRGVAGSVRHFLAKNQV
jgi:hypothetical protein